MGDLGGDESRGAAHDIEYGGIIGTALLIEKPSTASRVFGFSVNVVSSSKVMPSVPSTFVSCSTSFL